MGAVGWVEGEPCTAGHLQVLARTAMKPMMRCQRVPLQHRASRCTLSMGMRVATPPPADHAPSDFSVVACWKATSSGVGQATLRAWLATAHAHDGEQRGQAATTTPGLAGPCVPMHTGHALHRLWEISDGYWAHMIQRWHSPYSAIAPVRDRDLRLQREPSSSAHESGLSRLLSAPAGRGLTNCAYSSARKSGSGSCPPKSSSSRSTPSG